MSCFWDVLLMYENGENMGSQRDMFEAIKSSKVLIGEIFGVFAVVVLLGYLLGNGLSGAWTTGGFLRLAVIGLVSALTNHYVAAGKKAKVFYVLMNLLFLAVLVPAVLSGNTANRKMIMQTYDYAILFSSISFTFMKMGFQCRKKIWKGISLGVSFLTCLIPLLITLGYGIYFSFAGKEVNADIILALAQTNGGESMEYLSTVSAAGFLGGVVLSALAVSFVYVYIKMGAFLGAKNRLPLRVIGILCFLFVLSFLHLRPLPFILYKNTMDGIQGYEEFQKNRPLREKRLAGLPDMKVDPSYKGVYVLVIGESTTRDHMSAYGYDRNTTPWLLSMKKDPHMYLFTKAFSNHTHTVPSLTYALTAKNQYNHVPLEEAYTIMEVAKRAGFPTYWISNQVKYGAWDTPVAEIADGADHEVWYNNNRGKSLDTDAYDEVLVNGVKDISHLESGLIVYHTMGAHGGYRNRYPDEYSRFTGGENSDVNTYDNAVLYSDHVWQMLYENVKDNPNFKGFIYFSDHGEDPDHHKSHNATDFTIEMSEIPLFIVLSPSYEKDHPSIASELRRNEETYWTNDLLYDTLLSIMGIPDKGNEWEKYSLTRRPFPLGKEDLRTLHGQRKIEDSH